MKFTPEQVLAVLAGETFPMTTARLTEQCRENAGIGRFNGSPSEARDALAALQADGKVVSARFERRYGRPAENPYQFLCRGTGNDIWWMTTENAEVFRAELERQAGVLARARELGAQIEKAYTAHGVSVYATVDDYTGELRFRIDGEGVDALALMAGGASCPR